MIAIVSDIHANLEALKVVLDDIEKRHVDQVCCLGDLIGYGPNPREVIQLSLGFSFALRGNHEDALLFLAEDFNEDAAMAIDWTRNLLNAKDRPKEENHQLWNFLGDLRESESRDGYDFVHGSPRLPTREYVRPPDAPNKEKMEPIFDLIDTVCFGGHTHEPGVFTDEGKFLFPQTLQGKYRIPRAGKYLINVGSVGQPRDRDRRACYVTVDGDLVEWHRLEYDFQTTMQKIGAVRELSNHLARRLKDGR